jgi:hypothetical protein
MGIFTNDWINQLYRLEIKGSYRANSLWLSLFHSSQFQTGDSFHHCLARERGIKANAALCLFSTNFIVSCRPSKKFAAGLLRYMLRR